MNKLWFNVGGETPESIERGLQIDRAEHQRRVLNPIQGDARGLGNSLGNSQVQFCNGGYIARSGCYPFCPSPSGWGCDTGTQGGSNPLGLTQNYTVTDGDVSAGNTTTRAYSPVIDPYQRITPDMISFNGGSEGNRWEKPVVYGVIIGASIYAAKLLIDVVLKTVK